LSAVLKLSLQPKQGLAYRSPATELLYGGAAGGGKSHLMRVALICWCQAIPGLQCYLFRRTFPELTHNHLRGPTGFSALLAPLASAGVWIRGEREVIFPNGSRIYLCHCRNHDDIYAYQGAQMHVLAIDELTHWTEPMYRFLRSRVRPRKRPVEQRGRNSDPQRLQIGRASCRERVLLAV
jgi:hypothetical protein